MKRGWNQESEQYLNENASPVCVGGGGGGIFCSTFVHEGKGRVGAQCH
jgi:hypothetical protein